MTARHLPLARVRRRPNLPTWAVCLALSPLAFSAGWSIGYTLEATGLWVRPWLRTPPAVATDTPSTEVPAMPLLADPPADDNPALKPRRIAPIVETRDESASTAPAPARKPRVDSPTPVVDDRPVHEHPQSDTENAPQAPVDGTKQSGQGDHTKGGDNDAQSPSERPVQPTPGPTPTPPPPHVDPTLEGASQ